MGTAKELASIPSKHKQLDSLLKSLNGASKTARTTGQASEIMSQFRSISFNGIGLTFIGKRLMMPRILDQIGIGRAAIGIVLLS